MMVIDEELIRNDSEGSGLSLMQVLSRYLPGGTEKK
jgi:hypothetical protein